MIMTVTMTSMTTDNDTTDDNDSSSQTDHHENGYDNRKDGVARGRGGVAGPSRRQGPHPPAADARSPGAPGHWRRPRGEGARVLPALGLAVPAQAQGPVRPSAGRRGGHQLLRQSVTVDVSLYF